MIVQLGVKSDKTGINCVSFASVWEWNGAESLETEIAKDYVPLWVREEFDCGNLYKGEECDKSLIFEYDDPNAKGSTILSRVMPGSYICRIPLVATVQFRVMLPSEFKHTCWTVDSNKLLRCSKKYTGFFHRLKEALPCFFTDDSGKVVKMVYNSFSSQPYVSSDRYNFSAMPMASHEHSQTHDNDLPPYYFANFPSPNAMGDYVSRMYPKHVADIDIESNNHRTDQHSMSGSVKVQMPIETPTNAFIAMEFVDKSIDLLSSLSKDLHKVKAMLTIAKAGIEKENINSADQPIDGGQKA